MFHFKRYYILFCLSFSFSLKSQLKTWTGTTDTDWHKQCNWNPSVLPSCADSVLIPNTVNKPTITGIAHSRVIELRSSTGAQLNISGTGRLDIGQVGGCVGVATNNGGCVVPNLLPNPSFEDRSCCPTGLAQMNCVDFWINASSGGSTDYLNTCGFYQPGGLYGDPPLPFPDGTGILGFLDTRQGLPCVCVRKEYLGVCLTGPLTNGQTYTFDFHIANANGAYPITMSIFGNTSCAAMPNASTDCPTAWGTGWVEMGSVALVPTNANWTKSSITFTATAAFNGLIIGANCVQSFAPQAERYFYLDSLALY